MKNKWNKGHIIDFFELQRGFDLTEDKTEFGQIPVITSSGISYFHNEYKCSSPGVITGRKGKIGKVYFVTENYWPHDTTLFVKNFKNNFPEFVKIFLENLNLEKFDEASSVPTLNRNNIHKLKCLFPPLPEQKAIADMLSTWDEAIETTDRLIQAKEMRFKWLLNDMMSPGSISGEDSIDYPQYTALCKNARKKIKLGDLEGREIKIEKGKSLSRELKIDGEIPVVAGGQTYAYFTNCYTHEMPTVTVSASGAYAGFVWYHNYPIWASDCNILFAIKGITKFLYFSLKAEQHKIYSLQSGGAQPHVYSKDIKSLLIWWPPIEEQQQISETLSFTQQEIDLLKQLLEKYKTQKRGMMQKMLTGQWRIKPEIVKLYEEA
ncbi:restriction endonuclease subunit S [Myxococcota bacterium]|nr:restriction endonuclease subunit S [Myxococcota bacterium]MBU1379448.1 restriction endonuclease subunit S [Myxococcota bacterium]MBU1496151.1 restriction endonuclease subunit S [Myxococcota bacterium]